jgi:hypothetical protein
VLEYRGCITRHRENNQSPGFIARNKRRLIVHNRASYFCRVGETYSWSTIHHFQFKRRLKVFTFVIFSATRILASDFAQSVERFVLFHHSTLTRNPHEKQKAPGISAESFLKRERRF